MNAFWLAYARAARRLRKGTRYRWRRVVHWWWGAQNWRRGYQWRPIQRFHCCAHTTPYHYSSCPKWEKA